MNYYIHLTYFAVLKPKWWPLWIKCNVSNAKIKNKPPPKKPIVLSEILEANSLPQISANKVVTTWPIIPPIMAINKNNKLAKILPQISAFALKATIDNWLGSPHSAQNVNKKTVHQIWLKRWAIPFLTFGRGVLSTSLASSTVVGNSSLLNNIK